MFSDLDFTPHLITHTPGMNADFKGFSWILWLIGVRDKKNHARITICILYNS